MPHHSTRAYFIVAASIAWAFLVSIWFFVYKAPLPHRLERSLGGWQVPALVILLLLTTTVVLYLRGRRKDISRTWLFVRLSSNLILIVGLLGLTFWHWTSGIIITLVFGAFAALRGLAMIRGPRID